MKMSFASSRQSLFLLFAFLLVAAAFTIFYFKQVDDRKDQLIQRNFRQLNAISTAIQSKVNGLVTVISTTINDTSLKNCDAIRSKLHDLITGSDSIKVDSVRNFTTPNNEKLETSKPKNFNSVSTWFEVRNDSLLLGMAKSYAAYKTIIKVKGINEIIDKKKKQNLFDDFFIVSNYGEVKPTSKTMSISTIKKVSELNKKDSVNFSDISTSDAIAKYTLGGEEYLLFIHPTRLYAEYTNREWIICGIIKSGEFQSESQAVSANAILVFIVVIILIALSWPLLKLRFAGKYEHIRTADIVLASLSVLFGAAIFTFILLDIFVSMHQDNNVDNKLNSLAVNLSNNFFTEIKEIDHELDSLSKHSDTLKTKQYGNLKSIKYASQYPYFDMIVWINSANGMQKYKLLMKNKKTPFVSLQNRDYYKNVANHNLWNIDNLDEGIFIQPVITWTTGEFTTTLSKEVTFHDSSYVGAIDFIPLSIYSPVLPRGYSFCIIDNNGQVLFHSNPDLNLLENFFDECDNSGFIQTAVKSRVKEYFNTDYWGKNINGFIYPLKGLPWSIITMYDKDILIGNNVVITSLSSTLFLLYLIPFFSFLIIFMTFKASHRNSIWPQADKNNIYLKLTITYIFFSLILIIHYIASRDLNNAFIVTWLYPHSAVIFSIILLITKLRKYEIKDDKKLAVLFFLVVIIDASLVYLILSEANVSWQNTWLVFLIWFITNLLTASFLLNISFLKNFNLRIIQYYKHQTHEKTILKTTKIYTLAFTSFLILGAVIPAVGFFNISYRTEIKSSIKQMQMDFNEKMKEREIKIKGKYKADTYYNWDSLKSLRLKDSLDIYLPQNSARITFANNKDTCFGSISSWLDTAIISEIIPRFHQANINTLTSIQKPCFSNSTNDSLMSIISVQNTDRKVGGTDSIHAIVTKIPGLNEAFLSTDSNGKLFLKLLSLIFILTSGLYFLYSIILYITKSAFLINANDLSYFLKDNCLIKEASGNVLLLTSDKSLVEKLNNEILCHEKESEIKSELIHINFSESLNKDNLKAKNDFKGENLPMPSLKDEGMNFKKIVIIDDFEYGFTDPEVNLKKFLFLEEQLYVKNNKLIVLSSVNPIGGFYLNQPNEDNNIKQKNLKRWENIFSGFVSLSWCYNQKEMQLATGESEKQPGSNKSFYRFLKTIFIPSSSTENLIERELCNKIVLNFHPELKSIASKLSKIKNEILEEKNLDESAVFDIAMERTRSYHQHLWDLCSIGEKLVLTRLVKDRLVSVSNIKVVEALLRRGLVKRDPNLKPFNSFFTQFIREADFNEEDYLDKKDLQNGWALFRIPIILIFLGIIIFLFSTQSEIYKSTLTLIPTITLLIPFLLKLLGMFQSKQAISKGSE